MQILTLINIPQKNTKKTTIQSFMFENTNGLSYKQGIYIDGVVTWRK